MAGTYFSLRWGLAAIAFVFPLLLYFGGTEVGVSPQNSMSAYYHAGGPASGGGGPMRDVFVGTLFALGALLYLYKGFGAIENVGLNVAGVLAIGVAIFPMDWGPAPGGSLVSLHGFCAVTAFVALAVVIWTSSFKTLGLIPSSRLERWFKIAYVSYGVLMLLVPLSAYVVTSFLKIESAWVFVTEAFGIWVFAAYWATKAVEMYQSRADRLALSGDLIPMGYTLPTWGSGRPGD